MEDLKLKKKILRFYVLSASAVILSLWILFRVSGGMGAGGSGSQFWMRAGGLTAILLVFFFFWRRFLQRSVIEPVERLNRRLESAGFRETRDDALLSRGDDLARLAKGVERLLSSFEREAGEHQAVQIKLESLLGEMMEGVLSVRRDRGLIFMNDRAQKILELPEKGKEGAPLLEVVRDQPLVELMGEAIRTARTIDREVELMHVGRKAIRVRCVGYPVEKSEAVAGILLFYDLTDVKRLESLRRDFVANVSHELKTPLTSIKGFIETLLEGNVTDPGKKESFLRIMQEDADRLTRLIQDLLEISMLESRKNAVKKTSLNLNEEIRGVLKQFEIGIQKKELKVDCFTEPFQISADKDQLKQVLMNLLDNAVKFTPKGGLIAISAEIQDGMIRVCISDSGIGIPDKDVQRIFERFYRVDKARSREMGGTGLGLAIVKHVVENHGGRVWCESRPEKGSQFTFALPV